VVGCEAFGERGGPFWEWADLWLRVGSGYGDHTREDPLNHLTSGLTFAHGRVLQ
jgi:hypothetical protein